MSLKASYVAKAEAELADVEYQLSALAIRAEMGLSAGRARSEQLLLAAKSKHAEALHRFDLLKRAGEDGWESVKATFETSWAELRQALSPKD